jgi:two-component system, LuxR family, response regulator FixJ
LENSGNAQMGQQVDFASEKPVVVIVDDDPAVRSSLAFSLETEGIAARASARGAELLLELPNVGCLVIDYKLTGMNGLDLLAELRRRRVVAPAILITTHPSSAVRARAAASGTALIEKPLLGDALFREIRAALAV